MEVKKLKNYSKRGLNQCEEDTSTAATLHVPMREGKRSARWLRLNWCPPPPSKPLRVVPLNSPDKIHSSQKAVLPISAESCEFIPTSSCPPQESWRSSLLIDDWTDLTSIGSFCSASEAGKVLIVQAFNISAVPDLHRNPNRGTHLPVKFLISPLTFL